METPIADMVEKMLAENVSVGAIVSAIRAIETITQASRDASRYARDVREMSAERSRRYRLNKSTKIVAAVKADVVESVTHIVTPPSRDERDAVPLSSISTELVVKQRGSQGKKELQPELLEGQRKKVSRGTRLPDEWVPSDIDIAFASKRGMRLFEIEIEATKFRNYWTNRTDRDACKPRWDRAWQNWILNVKTPMNGGRNATTSAGDRARQFASKIREVEFAKGVGRPPDLLGGDRDSGDDFGSIPARQSIV